MRLALIATPAYAPGDPRPPRGTLDGDLVRTRLPQDDARFEVRDLRGDVDLAEQLDAVFDGLGGPPPTETLLYASCAVTLLDDGDVILSLDPSHPETGDSLGTVVDVVRERAPGAILFVLDCRPLDASADERLAARIVQAARKVFVASGGAAELLFAVTPPDGGATGDAASPFTRMWLAALDDADPTTGLTTSALHQKLAESDALAALVPAFVHVPAHREFVLVPPVAPAEALAKPPVASPAAQPHATGGAAPPAPAAAALPFAPPAGEGPSSATAPRARGPVPARTAAEHVQEGSRLLADGDAEGALSELRKALAMLPVEPTAERAAVYFAMARARRKQGHPHEALASFEKGLAIVPHERAAWEEVLELYAGVGDWHAVRHAEDQVLAMPMDSAERGELLVQYGRRWHELARDAAQALERFEAARQLLPAHGTVLERLATLYEEQGNWHSFLSVRRSLAEIAPSAAERARRYMELGEKALYQFREEAVALDLFEAALDADPTALEPLEALATLLANRQEWRELEAMYRRTLARADEIRPDSARVELLWQITKRLALVLRDHLGDPAGATAAFRRALELRPDDVRCRLTLVELLQRTGDRDGALAELELVSRHEPGRPATYRAVMQLALEAGRRDRAACAAAVLASLGQADDAVRALLAVPRGAPSSSLVDGDWRTLGAGSRELGGVLAAIGPTAIQVRLEQLAREGKLARLDPAYRCDPGTSDVLAVRGFAFAARVLGVPAPALHLRPDFPGTLAAVAQPEPTTVAGAAYLRDRPPAELAFLAARHLAFYRREHYPIVFFPMLDDLNALLLAAILLVLPNAPVPMPLWDQVHAFRAQLEAHLPPADALLLRDAVQEFEGAGGRADLGAWAASIERTACRAGLLVCGDLAVAEQVVRGEERTGVLSAEEKIADLHTFAISGAHEALRARLGFAVA